jgi:hypothetical protein
MKLVHQDQKDLQRLIYGKLVTRLSEAGVVGGEGRAYFRILGGMILMGSEEGNLSR